MHFAQDGMYEILSDIQGCTVYGNPSKSWIFKIVKSKPGNPGKLDLCTNELKFISIFGSVTTSLFVRHFSNISGITGHGFCLMVLEMSWNFWTQKVHKP